MKVCIKTENLSSGCVTDNKQPTFTLNITSDKQGAELKRAQISVGEWRAETDGRIHIPYGGEPLKAFTEYGVKVEAEDNFGEKAYAATTFSTGRMDTPWSAKWITDGSYKFTDKKTSPVPMLFKKSFKIEKTDRKSVV